MIKARHELDSLHIQLPRRQGSTSRAKYKTLLLGVGLMLLASCSNVALQAVAGTDAHPALFFGMCLLVFAPYLGIWYAVRRGGVRGEVVISQRMLRMEGRNALEIPLEEVQRIEMITHGDRGRLRFHTTHGEHDLFDGLFLHELEWLHRTVAEHTERLRLQMHQDGYDTGVVARPPEALTKLVE